MRAASAVGATVLGALLTIRPIARNVGVKMLGAVGVFGLGTVAFGLSTNYWLSLALLAVMGAAEMVSVFIRGTLVQLNTPDEMRGRVGAISGLAISASNELGEMESGLAAALLGATGAVVFGGSAPLPLRSSGRWPSPDPPHAQLYHFPQCSPKVHDHDDPDPPYLPRWRNRADRPSGPSRRNAARPDHRLSQHRQHDPLGAGACRAVDR
jgi:hypothetical protein